MTDTSTRDILPGFGSRLREHREAAGITQAALAAASGVAGNTIWRLESETRAPSLRIAMRLARALGIDMNTLTAGVDLEGRS